jgi:hypothetical protein
MIFYSFPKSLSGVFMRPFLSIAAVFFAAAVYPAFAQNTSANARLGGGKTVTVNAVKPAEGAAYLEIALPSGTQKLDGLGDQFMPLKSGGREAALVAADFNKDGIDEIVVRGQVTSTESAIIVFQWNAAQSQFLPIEITNAGDNRKPFLFTDNKSSVSIENNRIEVHLTRVDRSGRSAQVVERYRWDGDGLKYFEDH